MIDDRDEAAELVASMPGQWPMSSRQARKIFGFKAKAIRMVNALRPDREPIPEPSHFAILDKKTCGAITQKGTPCRCRLMWPNGLCDHHGGPPAVFTAQRARTRASREE